MKSRTGVGIILVLWLAFMPGCKEKQEFNAESGQTAVDARSAQGESDEVIRDVNIAIMEDFLLRGRSSDVSGGQNTTGTSLCGVKLDTSGAKKGVVTMLYTNVNCFGRTRSGKVKFTIENYPVTKWKNTAASVKIEYIGYKMVRASDNKSIQFDGVQYMTNETGNTWFDLWYAAQPAVVYNVKGSDMKVTFDGTETAVFNFERRLTFTYANNVTTCRVEGKGSFNGKSNLENWGQNREGDVFTTEIIDPPVWKSECGAMAPVSGQVNVKVEDKAYDIECYFGTNDVGEAISTGCPFGFRIEWSRKKRTNTRVFGYY